MSEDIKELRKQIEALQQEYDELDTGHSKLFKAYCEMKQEAEQLSKEMDEICLISANRLVALEQARDVLILSKIHTESCFTTVHKVVDKALAAIDKVVGG